MSKDRLSRERGEYVGWDCFLLLRRYIGGKMSRFFFITIFVSCAAFVGSSAFASEPLVVNLNCVKEHSELLASCTGGDNFDKFMAALGSCNVNTPRYVVEWRKASSKCSYLSKYMGGRSLATKPRAASEREEELHPDYFLPRQLMTIAISQEQAENFVYSRYIDGLSDIPEVDKRAASGLLYQHQVDLEEIAKKDGPFSANEAGRVSEKFFLDLRDLVGRDDFPRL